MTTTPRFALTLLALAAACTPTTEGEQINTDDTGPEPGDESSSSEDEGDSSSSETDEPPPPAECPEPTDGPTMATDVTADTTWTAAGSPYIVAHDLSIRAALTLEPCTQVLIDGGHGIVVRDAGSVTGIGTETTPIRIGASDPAAPWTTIRIYHGNVITLAHATIEDGGAVTNSSPLDTAMIHAQAVDAPTHDTLDFDHVTLRGSASQAVLLVDGARFAASSTALVATENASHPVSTWANGLSTLPDGDYTGNGEDSIFVVGGGPAAIDGEDVTIHDRGVPYVIGDGAHGTQLRVVEALLTIEPGVELQFGADGGLHVDYGSYAGVASAALVAVGTPDAPIVFTSSSPTPAPGDWYGVYFWNQPDPRDAITHARVEFAGGVSQIGSGACTTDGIGTHDAAIRLLGTGGQIQPDAPSGQLVTHTQIVSSAGGGIDRGWFGDEIDYLDTNEFTDVAQCLQSFPHPIAPGVCPDPAPCPRE